MRRKGGERRVWENRRRGGEGEGEWRGGERRGGEEEEEREGEWEVWGEEWRGMEMRR